MPRRLFMLLAGCTLVAGCQAPVVNSQAPVMGSDLPAEFQTFIQQPSYSTYLQQRLSEYEPPFAKVECAETRVLGRHDLSIIQPTRKVAGSLVPESGVWVDRLDVDRCGKRARRSLYIVARGRGQLQAVPLTPGYTGASPQLQQDVTMLANPAVARELGCRVQETVVIDTTGAEDVRPGMPWREEWTYRGCGKTKVLLMNFQPSSRGGTTFQFEIKP